MVVAGTIANDTLDLLDIILKKANIEYGMSKYGILSFLLKGLSVANPPFGILRTDIQYSTVHCLFNLGHTTGKIDPNRGMDPGDLVQESGNS